MASSSMISSGCGEADHPDASRARRPHDLPAFRLEVARFRLAQEAANRLIGLLEGGIVTAHNCLRDDGHHALIDAERAQAVAQRLL